MRLTNASGNMFSLISSLFLFTMQRQRRSPLVLCRCQSHCTIYNPLTRLYDGNGFWISRSSRDSHSRDDRLRRVTTAEQALAGPTNAHNPNGNQRNNWVHVYHTEVEVLSTLPITSRRYPLVFSNSPRLNGPFVKPSDHEIVVPNHGIHQLTPSRANRAFLEIEARYCELFSFVQQMRPLDEDAIDLLDMLYTELRRLNREKEVQWTEQRSLAGMTDVCYVNTGQ